MATTAPIIDLYAGLNHKAAMGSGEGPKYFPPTWVSKDHIRRLTAYQILDAYVKNNSNYYRRDPDEREGLREYGDAETVVEAVHSALIGDSQSFSVANAEDFDPDFDPEGKSEEEVEAQELAEQAVERQGLVDRWTELERTIIKITGAEKKAIKLGDTVYTLTWMSKLGRPKLRTYDPSFYFPVFSDMEDEEFPSKVHLAWEIEDPENPNKKRLRRITYELKDIDPDAEGGWPEGVTFREDEQLAALQLPWNPPDEPATQLCYVSDGVWEIDTHKMRVDDLDESKATWRQTPEGVEMRNMSLNIDFLPIVHVPNTEEDEEHFGASILLRVAQLLDDVSKSDTSVIDTAANSGFPAIGFEGGEGPEKDDKGEIKGGWGPGSFLHNPNGRINVLSTESALEPLSNLVDRLLERLSVNARIPSSVLGRDEKNASESGLHLSLSWGPLRSMIGQMRLSRQEKYSLLLKFVQRFYQLGGDIEEGPENVLPVRINFGAFLPTDRKAAIEEISTLIQRKLISTRTGLTMLIELGIPIDDAQEELQRIQQEDFEGAINLLEATGNEVVVSQYLGREVTPETPQAPEF